MDTQTQVQNFAERLKRAVETARANDERKDAMIANLQERIAQLAASVEQHKALVAIRDERLDLVEKNEEVIAGILHDATTSIESLLEFHRGNTDPVGDAVVEHVLADEDVETPESVESAPPVAPETTQDMNVILEAITALEDAEILS